MSNAEAIVKQAIVDYTAGLLDGQPGLVVGADVSPFEAAGAINIAEPSLQVLKIEVTKQAVINFQPTNIEIDPLQKAFILGTGSITVTVAS